MFKIVFIYNAFIGIDYHFEEGISPGILGLL